MTLYHVAPQKEAGEKAPNMTEAKLDFASSGDNTIVSATSGQTTRVYRIFFTVADDVDVVIKDGTTALTGAITMFAGGSFVLDFQKEPWFTTSANSAFVINLSGAIQASGRIYFIKD